jgi:hypothetical protein
MSPKDGQIIVLADFFSFGLILGDFSTLPHLVTLVVFPVLENNSGRPFAK